MEHFVNRWCVLLFAATLCGCVRSPVLYSGAPDERVCPVGMALDMRLADTPGPAGMALAYTPWILSVGPMPDGMDLIEPVNQLAKGETDDEGRISLSEEQEGAARIVLCDASKSVWLSYPGQTVRVNVVVSQSDWTEDQRLFYLLKSYDLCRGIEVYTPDLLASQAGKECVDEAMGAYGVDSVEALSEVLLPRKENDR